MALRSLNIRSLNFCNLRFMMGSGSRGGMSGGFRPQQQIRQQQLQVRFSYSGLSQ